jgi:hypothetical protein
LKIKGELLRVPTIQQSQMTRGIALIEHTRASFQLFTVNGKEWIERLVVNYTYKRRLAAFKKDFQHIWESIFVNTPVVDVKSIVGMRNTQNHTKALVRKRYIFV